MFVLPESLRRCFACFLAPARMCAFAGVCLLIGPVQMYAEEVTLEQRGKFLLNGIRAHRERLETGSFRVTGVVADHDEQIGDFHGKLRLFCSFDFPNGKLRFDREDPVRGSSEEAGKKEALIEGGQFVRTRERIIANMRGHETVHLLPLHDNSPQSWAQPIDVRALGMAFHYERKKEVSFDAVWRDYEKMSVASAVEQGAGVWKITWLVGNAIEAQMTLDTQRDYWPLELSVRGRAASKRDGARAEPVFTSTLNVVKRHGLWVPSTFTWRSYGYSQNWTFEWESVNEALDEKRFTVDDLDLSSTKRIVDLTLGKPVTVRDLVAEARANELALQARGIHRRLWLTVLSAVFVILAIGALIMRQRARRVCA